MSRQNFENFDINAGLRSLRAEVEAYPGDEFWAECLADEYGSVAEAAKTVQTRGFVQSTLAGFGLEGILADKHATDSLRKALLDDDAGIIKTLVDYAKRRKKGRDGRPLWQIIAEYDALKLSDSKIAKIVYGDASKANLVAAHLARARRKPESRKLKAG